jgi:hypothetical protein
MKPLSFFVFTALHLLLAGCNDNTKPGIDSQPMPPPIDAAPPTTAPFCAAVAGPFCEALYACCNDVQARYSHYLGGFSVDECKAWWSRSACLWDSWQQQLDASLAAGQTVLDQAKLDACVTHLKALAAGERACTELPGSVLKRECLAAFQGPIAPGGACTWPLVPDLDVSFIQCKDGGCVQGKCIPFLKTGDACIAGTFEGGSPGEICNLSRGEWCLGVGDAGTCGPRGDVGDACTYDDYGYQCKSRNCDEMTGKCILPGESLACSIF